MNLINIKKINLSRGFLVGPYIPIYGTAAIVMSFLLTKYQTNLIVLFVMSSLICTIIEYFTSYVMEKVYKLRWWDYSNIKPNFGKYICLQNSLIWGILGTIYIHIFKKFTDKIINQITNKETYIFISLFIIDTILVLITKL